MKKVNKKEKFVEYVGSKLFNNVEPSEIPEDVLMYWNAFKGKEEADKPLFTDNGKMILEQMQKMADTNQLYSAKSLAEEIFISSKTVSGAMRKLVSDGYVDKMGADPVLYTLTEKGKNIKF